LGAFPKNNQRGNEAYALRLPGEFHARHNPSEIESAEAHYRQALTLADALSMRPLQAHCHLGLGMLYIKTGQREQARAELSMAIGLYRAHGYAFLAPAGGSRTGTNGRGRASTERGRQTPLDRVPGVTP
jgi:tetratricopeptide (TPR) repeat protein